MKKLGCATLLMVLLVLACVAKATLLKAQEPAVTTPAIPASCVAVGQPRMDAHHTVQLIRCGTQFQVLGREDQGPTYVIVLSAWFPAGNIASLAYATFPLKHCLKVYVLRPTGEPPALVGLDKC
ncbi:MAG: hypothetical protein ACJ8CB_26525 [Ktedonobacteraceae bacterium]